MRAAASLIGQKARHCTPKHTPTSCPDTPAHAYPQPHQQAATCRNMGVSPALSLEGMARSPSGFCPKCQHLLGAISWGGALAHSSVHPRLSHGCSYSHLHLTYPNPWSPWPCPHSGMPTYGPAPGQTQHLPNLQSMPTLPLGWSARLLSQPTPPSIHVPLLSCPVARSENYLPCWTGCSRPTRPEEHCCTEGLPRRAARGGQGS